MAQLVVSWFICDGAIRVHAINAVGRRKGRIIEVEVVDTGERFHGSARRLERLVHSAPSVQRRVGPSLAMDTRHDLLRQNVSGLSRRQ